MFRLVSEPDMALITAIPLAALKSKFEIELHPETTLLTDGAAIANVHTLAPIKPHSARAALNPISQNSKNQQQQQQRHIRSRALSEAGIILMNHNSRHQISVQPNPIMTRTPLVKVPEISADDAQLSARLKEPSCKTRRPTLNNLSLSATMNDLMNAYMSPLRSNPELAESGFETPLPLENWQRTLLHLAAERGVVMKIKEFVERDCGGALLAKKYIEMPGDVINGDRPLHLAAKGGHAEAVKQLIEYGAVVDAANRYCDTALILAVKGGHLACSQALLKLGATAMARGRNGQTAFHWACAMGHLEIFKLLIENIELIGGEIDVSRALEAQDFSEDGNTCFHLAALGNHVNVTSYIALIRPGICEIKNAAQYTPLHLAARQGRMEMCRWLVEEQKVDLEALGWYNKTPLHKAAETARLDVMAFLLDHGADIEATELQLGGTAMHVAAMYGQAKSIDFLIKRGAAVTKATTLFGFEALHVAAFYGKTEVIDELIQTGHANIDTKGSLGRTALILAASSGHLATAEYLVENGASLEERDDQLGGTPLHFACWFGQLPIIEFLLKSGAERCSRDHAGDSPLHWACLACQAKAVAFLLTRGAETGAKDDRIGRTPLHDSCSKGFTEVVELLLSRADIQAVDAENGATSLHLASWFGRLEVMNLLITHRAKLEARCQNNYTPLHWAVMNNQIEAVKLLVERGAQVNLKGGKCGRTALHMAAEWGRVDIAMFLLNRGALREATDDRHLQRPLHLAAQMKHPQVVQLLLERRANSFAQDEQGHTPLHLAVRQGQSASLLDARKWREAELKAKTGLGAKSMEDAVAAGRWAMTEDLLRSNLLKQNPEKRMDETSRRQSEVINLLLDHSPDLLFIRTHRFGRSVLHVAAQAGQLVAVQTLMDRGADAKARDKIGKTPLKLAFDNSKYDIVRLFVKLGISD